MANRRTISREIATHTGLDARTTEKILRTYFTILSATAKTGAGMGHLGAIRCEAFAENIPGAHAIQFRISEGLHRAVKMGTLPPHTRKLVNQG